MRESHRDVVIVIILGLSASVGLGISVGKIVERAHSGRINTILSAPAVITHAAAVDSLRENGYTLSDLSEEQAALLDKLPSIHPSRPVTGDQIWTELHQGVLTDLSFERMHPCDWEGKDEDFAVLRFEDGEVIVVSLSATYFGWGKTTVAPIDVSLGEVYCVFFVVGEGASAGIFVLRESETERVEKE